MKISGISSGISSNEEYDYLSRDAFISLKGCFTVFIIIHHLFQFSEILNLTSISFVFYNLGCWGVAGFMFISGYGLGASLDKKGAAYIESFPRHRILPLYTSHILFAIIYFFYDLITGNPHSLTEIAATLTYGGTIVSFGWYIQEILLIYIVFWAVFAFLPGEKFQVPALYVFCVIRVLAGIIMHQADMSHTPAAFFAVGFFFYTHRQFFDQWMGKLWIILFPLCFSVFFGGYLYMWRNRPTGSIVYAFRIVCGIAFLACTLMLIKFIMKYAEIILVNPVFSFLGNRSLEIYACQGLVLKSLYFLVVNRYVYAAACAAVIVLLGSFLHWLIPRIMPWVRS